MRTSAYEVKKTNNGEQFLQGPLRETAARSQADLGCRSEKNTYD